MLFRLEYHGSEIVSQGHVNQCLITGFSTRSYDFFFVCSE